MEQVKFITLAAARNRNPKEFDSIIKNALREAAAIVGKDATIRALSPNKTNLALRKVA